VTKPGNSGSEEPTQAEAPETTAQAHESPTGAPGGPPNSTLPESTDNSAAAEDAAAEPEPAEPEAAEAEPEPAETKATEAADATAAGANADSKPAKGEPAAESAEAKPADAESAGANADPKPAKGEPAAESAEAKPADAEPAAADPAVAKPAEKKAAAPKPAEPKPVRPSKVRKAAADPEPLMAELEKAPPPPHAEALRAQAKRRFEEPPPRTLRFSFYFFVGAGFIWLVTGVLFLVNKQSIVNDQVASGDNNGLTPDEIARALTQILWIYLVMAAVFAAFLGLFGYKATEGARRARTLVTIFSAILVLFHLFVLRTPYGLLSAIFALIGLALLWSPSARKYFPSRQLP
jgi:hypothetical protein